ncbi:MAG: cytochrome c-type biogenesis protein CcmH [Candidatus Rokubacteria bacterium]|nr:cytochrome c-type biogenesis protein CcmH [Candidatus Rokubacteria bacterium]
MAVLVFAAPAVAGEDLEDRMREVASGLRCPVCQNLSVADSSSEMAREMRALIVDQLRAGKRPDEIRAYFVSKYGQWILLSPTPRGVGLVVWIVPTVGAVAGLGGAAWLLRRWSRREKSPLPPVDVSALSRIREAVRADDSLVALAPEEARLVEALRELRFDYRAGKLSDGDYEELRTLYETRAAAALARPKRPRPERAAAGASVPEAAAAGAAPRPARPWRWVAAALFLIGFGATLGYFLPQSVRARGEGSPTGDFLTGTREEAARAEAPDLPVLLERGRQAMEAGEWDRAIGFFRRALEADPDEPTAHASLGLILHRAGHPDRALKSFERALARDPASPQALWGKGLVLYESLGKTAEAIRTWETLLAQEISKEDRDHVLSILAEARQRLVAQPGPAARSPR